MANRLSMIIGPQAGKDCQKFPVHLRMTQASGLALCYNRNICNLIKLFVVLSKYLAYPPLKFIAADSITYLTTGSYSQAGAVPAWVDNHYKMGRMITRTLFPGSLELA